MQNKINKLVLIILDGCQYKVALNRLGFMNHLVENKKATLYKVQSELPSNSRPLYEVLLTGVPVLEHTIYNNSISKCSKERSIFELVKDSGGTTGAAAYYWMSELYNRTPFDIKEDRVIYQENYKIQHGMFYADDAYPDSHLFADAHHIIKTNNPDFLVVHSMNIDDIGHKYSSESKEYAAAVHQADSLLSMYIPLWIESGYQIIVTSDHGMDYLGLHGGSLDSHRDVPLYLVSKLRKNYKQTEFNQLYLAPLICDLMHINPSQKMLAVSDIMKG